MRPRRDRARGGLLAAAGTVPGARTAKGPWPREGEATGPDGRSWDQAVQLVVLVVLEQVLVLEQLVDEPSMTSLASE